MNNMEVGPRVVRLDLPLLVPVCDAERAEIL